MKFVYESSPERCERSVKLSPQAFAAVPESLRRELADALESLDAELIDTLVARIAGYDPSLQAQLTKLAETFDYTAILTAQRGQ